MDKLLEAYEHEIYQMKVPPKHDDPANVVFTLRISSGQKMNSN